MEPLGARRFTSRNPRRPTTIEDQRRCEAAGCITILSRYNGGLRCWLHSAPIKRRVRASPD